jgi:hypothetical protein
MQVGVTHTDNKNLKTEHPPAPRFVIISFGGVNYYLEGAVRLFIILLLLLLFLYNQKRKLHTKAGRQL